ncbi:hypothetical protein A1F94_008454 [Pyrenophora tritici-repentis]|uniref:Uncharacterized protein n=2 Tax=Pyrenophora tritici-repentis TaxID=45151 RepID=A0A317AA57_9PLEO|nr:uncharacterized protein PTRG_10744 [Pyrenophora tritici-repentis Pt-1C-BFP]KAA8621419.1 hypothetical protein PtrV1_05920 [Pyrenophora tritici-repentis]EDU43794.1 predicted protein [Pyrenophora tritici-repentis Pt-1C-BFP]KAF7450652.1 hypothetical protein A1F99_052680 [Pyrenophora tritici-repentis]KAF7573272.1 hypothetical protein PtrM4_081770 [Pyrenophora tritici-repentis]KAG9381134.1 hypothetical protein A1F94_008454 [Pyrenophora tritici-repentis]
MAEAPSSREQRYKSFDDSCTAPSSTHLYEGNTQPLEQHLDESEGLRKLLNTELSTIDPSASVAR